MSTDTVPTATRARYLRLWAGVPKELLFLFIAFPIGVVMFAVSVGLFSKESALVCVPLLPVAALLLSHLHEEALLLVHGVVQLGRRRGDDPGLARGRLSEPLLRPTPGAGRAFLAAGTRAPHPSHARLGSPA